MKIAVAGVYHETNTFAPGKTELVEFQGGEWVDGNEAYLERYQGTRTSMGGVIDGARLEKAELVCGFYAGTTPSGMVSAAAADEIIRRIVDSIDPKVDGAVVILHGAMVAEQFPDMEAVILQRLRDKVGFAMPVAITLDLHANISEDIVRLADLIVGYDTYPHVDVYDRAVEATRLLARFIREEIKPVRSFFRPRMLLVPSVMVTDVDGPMQEIMTRAFAMEEDPDVLNVTVSGGFPYSDIADAGMSFVVTTNNNQALADQCAAELGQMAWDRRVRFHYQGLAVEDGVKQALDSDVHPVILVESSDNVGGGAPADATHVLRHLIGADRKCLIVIRDAEAAQYAHRQGVGAAFHAAIGGKSDQLHGEPVPVSGKIRLLFDGKFQHIGAYMTGQWADMGKTAVIEAGQVTIILTEHRTMPMDPGHVRSVGLNPADFHVIVVKSAVAWKTAFGDVAKRVIRVDTPGCCGENVHTFNYEQLKRPIYPLDERAQDGL